MASGIVLRARLVHRALRYRYKLNGPQIRAMMILLPRGGVAIDVGAHKGAYSYWMARRVGRDGRVLAFEPQTRVASITRESLLAAGFTQVQVTQAAVSDTCGIATIALRRNSTHGARLDGLTDTAGPVDHEEVEVITVDEAVRRAGVNRVDFVKIDVEGHEAAVLRGCAQTLRDHRPSVQVEIEARHHEGEDAVAEASQRMAVAGYRGYFFSQGKVRPIAEFDAEIHQRYGDGEYCNDFLFVHESRAGAARF